MKLYSFKSPWRISNECIRLTIDWYASEENRSYAVTINGLIKYGFSLDPAILEMTDFELHFTTSTRETHSSKTRDPTSTILWCHHVVTLRWSARQPDDFDFLNI